ncbi:unnamed protein product [Phaedon cochleariae]|uniref:Uncharacterized protein n=1 Tax=Phaedon cochleariae TaxID=80249 RepID=A0A9N9X3J8_PHACE|nr:unnamed protein product [Phaedon cochleariae]
MSHNIHNMLHISDDVENIGVLDMFSAFPFENKLQQLKKLVRKGDNPLAQIVKRIYEINKSEGENSMKIAQLVNKNTRIFTNIDTDVEEDISITKKTTSFSSSISEGFIDSSVQVNKAGICKCCPNHRYELSTTGLIKQMLRKLSMLEIAVNDIKSRVEMIDEQPGIIEPGVDNIWEDFNLPLIETEKLSEFEDFLKSEENMKKSAEMSQDGDNLENFDLDVQSPATSCSISVSGTETSVTTAFTSGMKRCKKRQGDSYDQILKKVSVQLDKPENSQDEFSIMGTNISDNLRKLPAETVIVVDKLITDILFEAQLGNIHRYTNMNLTDSRTANSQLHLMQPSSRVAESTLVNPIYDQSFIILLTSGQLDDSSVDNLSMESEKNSPSNNQSTPSFQSPFMKKWQRQDRSIKDTDTKKIEERALSE